MVVWLMTKGNTVHYSSKLPKNVRPSPCLVKEVGSGASDRSPFWSDPGLVEEKTSMQLQTSFSGSTDEKG